MHATTLRHASAIALVGLSAITVAGCGSSKDDITAIETTDNPTTDELVDAINEPATTLDASASTTDDPSTDELVDSINDPDTSTFHDLSLALDGFDANASNLSADEHTRFEHLKAAVADAEQANGADAATAIAIAQVQIEVAELHALLTEPSRALDADSLEAWMQVRAEFDTIEAAM